MLEKRDRDRPALLPIIDTISATRARDEPGLTLDYYHNAAAGLWASPAVEGLGTELLRRVTQGQVSWGSISGPWGFGKTSAAITLWRQASAAGFLSIPPLSCTGFDELAVAVAALSCAQSPKMQPEVQRLFESVYSAEINQIAAADSLRYEVSQGKMRQILKDKLYRGQLSLDSSSHRFAEFIARLGDFCAEWSGGLVLILDEMQQLLGPLDTRTVIGFRDFVWSMRTERSHCGLVFVFDSVLEARLAKWAADILHRIRENGLTVELSTSYDRGFPGWLWSKVSAGSAEQHPAVEAINSDVLLSLGQLVERPDLSNGPRTVTDVLARAVEHFRLTGRTYDIPDFTADIAAGAFRYLGEGARIQANLTRLVRDEWVNQSVPRRTLAYTASVFPLGCPGTTLARLIPDEEQLKRASRELFGPLLVETAEGLALEELQVVKHKTIQWEQLLSRSWDTLPSLDALAEAAPHIIMRTVIPELFPSDAPLGERWVRISEDAATALSGWTVLEGSFDAGFPCRRVAVSVSTACPEEVPQDVDVSVLFLCEAGETPASVEESGADSRCLVFHIPVMKPLDDEALPAGIRRFAKYVKPEPFRPITLLHAVSDMTSCLGTDVAAINTTPDAQAFADIVTDFVIHELLQGNMTLGPGRFLLLSGPELLHTLFSRACKRHYPQYWTLVKTQNWQASLQRYRLALSRAVLTPGQRQGLDTISGAKRDLMHSLFDLESTAVADSFLKSLGGLVRWEGTADSFRLVLALHPAEKDLYAYLRGVGRSGRFIPRQAAAEFLGHLGYTPAESEEVISLLAARQLIEEGNEGLRIISDEASERRGLLARIASLEHYLTALGAPADDLVRLV